MKGSGYDQKVDGTVSVAATKPTKFGHKTWGIMKGVIAMASEKVEEYTKEGISWNVDDWPRKASEKSSYYQEFGQDKRGWSYHQERTQTNKTIPSVPDDWDKKERREEPRKGTQSSQSWAGWDDVRDDAGHDNLNGKFGSLIASNGYRIPYCPIPTSEPSKRVSQMGSTVRMLNSDVFTRIPSVTCISPEGSRRFRNVHHDLTTQCPTAKTGLFGGGAFLALDAAIFWLICQMLTMNSRSDYFDEDDLIGEYGEVNCVTDVESIAIRHPTA
ncbi:hypothetical protein B296_00023103 [Ensete ventricosum]|uniref:Uncharacterized protein n=1 Tax=Ensete ventricosum TaxID=4639 RepID=A0A427AXK7_ENSVE|nr:hypothetical protein B296_00023103 [Ensete ventricosum]